MIRENPQNPQLSVLVVSRSLQVWQSLDKTEGISFIDFLRIYILLSFAK